MRSVEAPAGRSQSVARFMFPTSYHTDELLRAVGHRNVVHFGIVFVSIMQMYVSYLILKHHTL
jgi:hypothetical protein